MQNYGTPHVEIYLQDLQVVQTADTSDWRERQWTPEDWNGTKTCHPRGGGAEALSFREYHNAVPNI